MKVSTLLSASLLALLCISAPVMATDSNTDSMDDQSSQNMTSTNSDNNSNSGANSNNSKPNEQNGVSADTVTGEDDY